MTEVNLFSPKHVVLIRREISDLEFGRVVLLGQFVPDVVGYLPCLHHVEDLHSTLQVD